MIRSRRASFIQLYCVLQQRAGDWAGREQDQPGAEYSGANGGAGEAAEGIEGEDRGRWMQRMKAPDQSMDLAQLAWEKTLVEENKQSQAAVAAGGSFWSRRGCFRAGDRR